MDMQKRTLADAGVEVGLGLDLANRHYVWASIPSFGSRRTSIPLESGRATLVYDAIETLLGNVAARRDLRQEDLKTTFEWVEGEYKRGRFAR
jgi:hypothetical protein